MNQKHVDGSEFYSRGYYTMWMNLSHEALFPGSKMMMVFVVGEMAKYIETLSDARREDEVQHFY